MTRRRLLATTATGMLATLMIGALTATASAHSGSLPGRAHPSATQDITGSIVIIGTGGLSWSDVSAQATPALWSLLRDGATATLSVRSVHANTCPVDGWLTLSAGEQAAGGGASPDPAGPDGAKPPCQALPARMTAGKVPHWDDYVAAAAASRFDASLGLLANQVVSHGGCLQAVGPGAALGAARSNGIVDLYEPFDPATLTAALASCPATLIDVGPIRDPADVDPRDELRPATSRGAQVAALDARVAVVLKAAPSGADVFLASLADAGVTERLRLVAATGPHYGAGTLESRSTRQPGLVQLTDLTPTILSHLGFSVPLSLGGAQLRFVPAGTNSEHSATQRLRALLDDDEASHKIHSLVAPFFYGWVLLQLALYLISAVLWKLEWGTPAKRRQLLRTTHAVAIIAATVPVSTFLANLLPWWRFSVPLLSVLACVTIFSAVISSLALLGPWHRQLFGPIVVVCVATIAVLAVDMMTGSRLQLSSLMGLQPVVGGRYYGMGNVTFALFATATLLLCTAVGSHLVTVHQPRIAAAAAAAIGLFAVVVDGSPSWGSDLGGPPALLPALILLVLAILSIKLTWRRTLAVAGVTVAFVVLLGFLDWLRPPESRSHLGRFVQTVADGGAWDIIVRKLDQNVSLLFDNTLSLLIPIGLAFMAFLLARPSSRAAGSLRRSFGRVPLLRSGLIAIMVMWVIGFAVNDSGSAIPAVGATLALPLVLAIALRTLEDERLVDERRAEPATTRASRRLR